MATSSSDLLDVDEYERRPSHHRSRSGGYIDHLEEKTKLDRRDRERQMKRYHDSRHATSSSSHLLPTSDRLAATSDRLAVPVFETTRRGRSSSEAGTRDRDPGKRYNVQEVRPSPKPRTDYTLSSEPALPSQLPVRYERKPQQQKRPSIKVEIHQDNPPSSTVGSATKPRRSPSASPHSPTAQPQLQYQYAMLQNKLSQISNACAPYVKVEAANPEDLTHGKIAELAASYAFDLEVWAHVANLEGMAMIDPRKKRVVDAASHSLDRLLDRVTDLNDACLQAKPRDLKFEVLPQVDDDNLFEDGNDDRYVQANNEGPATLLTNRRSESDPTEALSFIIHSSLHGIELQIQNLKRLTRTLQEATPDAKEEVVAVAKLVAETVKYFGSQEALDRYRIDNKFAGRKGLEEARYANAY
jgi:hypothetical protein